MTTNILTMTACAVADALRAREIAPREVLGALSSRIDAVNPIINALPTQCFERAYGDCERRSAVAPLYGLPVPIKDSFEVKGVRTTWGSLAFEDHVATRSDYVVQAIERAGGVVYAKSNTPEFEAGASTFNEVFGRTLNPWNTSRSTAGSSGGAAAAVATGMAFIAQGSDFACSLRYPASFCGVVGLRPTPGLVPQGPGRLPYQVLSVAGPIARNVADIGLALDGMAGFEPGDPLTRESAGGGFRDSGSQPQAPLRFASSADLGIAVVSTEVRRIFAAAVQKLAAGGPDVEECHPDLASCHDAFRPLRAFQFSAMLSDLIKTARDKLKPELVWNVEQGLKLNASEIAAAEARRAELRHVMLAFLEQHSFLITPTAPVPPNPAEDRYVTEIEGVAMETYLDWLVLGYAITVTGCPVISVPCGFTQDGLPVGLQIVAPPFRENDLLSVAAWCEQVLGASLSEPIDPKEP